MKTLSLNLVTACAFLLLVFTGSPAQGALTDGLLVHLPLDGNANAGLAGTGGTETGTVSYAAGKFGQAAGTASYGDGSVLFNDDVAATVGSGTDFSGSFWLRYDSYSSDPAFFSNKSWASGNNTGINLAFNGGDEIDFNTKADTGSRSDIHTGNGAIAPGVWQNVIFTVDRDGATRLYIDGGQITNQTIPSTSMGSFDGSSNFRILNDGTGSYGFGSATSGLQIDEVGFWSRLLTAPEIAALQTDSIGSAVVIQPTVPTPAASWQFNNNLDNDIAGGDPLVNTIAPSAFDTATIDGVTAEVLDLSAASNASETLKATNPIGPNGGGGLTNNYTLAMDVNFPTFPGAGSFASLLETNLANNDDVDFFVRSNGNIDLETAAQVPAGITADTWYRLVFTNEEVGGSIETKLYVDGQFIGMATNAIDGDIALEGMFLLFSDNSGDTVDTLVNSVALWGEVLDPGQIELLGGASAQGLGPISAAAVPEPTTVALLSLVGLGLAHRRRRVR